MAAAVQRLHLLDAERQLDLSGNAVDERRAGAPLVAD